MRLIAAIVAVTVGIFFGVADVAHADAVTLVDTYWGGDPQGAGNGDRIGSNRFEIQHMTIAAAGNTMTFRVYTNFVNGSLGGSSGAELGDLFLSTDGWGAGGAGAAPQYEDDVIGGSNHESYEYAITLNDYSWDYDTGAGTSAISNASGTTGLYDLSAGGTVLATESFFGSGYRAGQEARYSPGSTSTVVTGTWLVGSDSSGWYLQYVITSSALATAFNNGDLGVHWGMTCGNDVIAGLVPVPEPGTLALVGAGLLCAGFARRRRNAKA